MKKASRELGFGDNWLKALEAVKNKFNVDILHVPYRGGADAAVGGVKQLVEQLRLDLIDGLIQPKGLQAFLFGDPPTKRQM